MEAAIRSRQVREHVWRLADIAGNRCYLVVGSERAALVDTMEGVGDVRSAVERITDLPVTVLLTHHHHDHVAGAYLFESAGISAIDDGFWEQEESFNRRIQAQLREKYDLPEGTFFSTERGARPSTWNVDEGFELDLGGECLHAVALPGHTAGSMGYVVERERVLLSGDAVTPCMTLFYDDSTPIAEWESTLERMAGLPVDAILTGHYDHEFSRADLASWRRLAQWAPTDPGMRWQNFSLPELRGCLHVMSPDGTDPDSPEFRALIEKPKPRVHRARRARRHRPDGDASSADGDADAGGASV